MNRRLRRKGNKGEGEAKGHLTSDLCVMAGALGGQRTQKLRVISNYRLDTTKKLDRREGQQSRVQLNSYLSAQWQREPVLLKQSNTKLTDHFCAHCSSESKVINGLS